LALPVEGFNRFKTLAIRHFLPHIDASSLSADWPPSSLFVWVRQPPVAASFDEAPSDGRRLSGGALMTL